MQGLQDKWNYLKSIKSLEFGSYSEGQAAKN